MKVREVLKIALTELIGKEVYFMKDNKIHCGKIGSHDGLQNIWIYDERNVRMVQLNIDCDFFFTIEDMISYLKETTINI